MDKKYLRIANRNPVSARGHFPRRLLLVMGATTSRKKTDTDHGTSQFGSGKKLAAVAALNLGMEIHLTSHDALGPFFYTYGSVTDYTMGEPQELLALREKTRSEVVTDISMHSAKNWGDPIGDDSVKEYHVFREYVQDAYTLDPESYSIQETDLVYPAVSGTTSVYITHVEGFAHILKHSDRYLKYLSGIPPIFSLEGVGAIYAKSESGMTRIFGRGQLASCSKSPSESSVYDYSLQKLSLMSEDRTFRSMYQVKRQLGLLLSSIDSVEIVKTLITEIQEIRGQLESAALRTLTKAKVEDLKVWSEAWVALHPEKEAVMSCFDHVKDEYVRHSCGKHVVKVLDSGLQKVLSLAGIPYTSAFYPDHKKNAKIVKPTPNRQKVFDQMLAILGRWRLLHLEFKTHVYRPIVEKKGDNPDLGFCIITSGADKGIFILERMTDKIRDAIETGYHEHVHARTDGALDGSRVFDNRKDTDMGRMLLIAERLLEMLIAKGVSEEAVLSELQDLIKEDEEQEEFELDSSNLIDFFEEDTKPRVSPETQKALDLIGKASDKPDSSK